MLFIDDGYTAAKRIDARPGLHAAADVKYRPALAAKRNEYQARLTGDPGKLSAWEDELLELHVVGLAGEPLKKGSAARLVPALRTDLLNLVLGYAGADEQADLGNSRPG
jgi:hypothetical protein